METVVVETVLVVVEAVLVVLETVLVVVESVDVDTVDIFVEDTELPQRQRKGNVLWFFPLILVENALVTCAMAVAVVVLLDVSQSAMIIANANPANRAPRRKP